MFGTSLRKLGGQLACYLHLWRWKSAKPDFYYKGMAMAWIRPGSLMCVCFSHSVVSDSLQTPWTLAYQAPLFMEFSRQEYWSGLPFPSPRDYPDSGITPRSPALMADSLPSKPVGKPNICIQIHTPWTKWGMILKLLYLYGSVTLVVNTGWLYWITRGV